MTDNPVETEISETINSLKEKYDEAEHAFEDGLYIFLMGVVGFRAALLKDQALWAEFSKRNPKASKYREKPYRWIIRAACEGLNDKQASKYGRACEGVLKSGGTAENFVEKIKELGGVEGAAAECAAAKKTKVQKAAGEVSPPEPHKGEASQDASAARSGKVESVFLPDELREGNVERQDLAGWQLIRPNADRKSFTIAPADAPSTAPDDDGDDSVDEESLDEFTPETAGDDSL